MNMLIEVNGLGKKYSKKQNFAIKDISLKGCGGEIVGILGHNGAGKSTTIKCLTGMHHYDEGSIKICGYDLKTDALNAKKNFGYVAVKFNKVSNPIQRGIELLNVLYVFIMVLMIVGCVRKMQCTLTDRQNKEIYLRLPVTEKIIVK